MTKQVRLDIEMVRRGLAASRAAAQRAIADGHVTVRGMPAGKPSALVSTADPIAVGDDVRRFVSRGGVKLDGAIDDLEIEVAGRRWLDAGASTGGFTDCLLQRGARGVVAVDVGYGQLAWALRNDPRVVVLERVNVKALTRAELPWEPDALTADLSFISAASVLPVLADLVRGDGDFVVLVKPQFEVGRGRVGKGGVVRDPDLWRDAVEQVAGAGRGAGLGVGGCAPSRILGPAGNVEFFLHMARRMSPGRDPGPQIAAAVAAGERLALA